MKSEPFLNRGENSNAPETTREPVSKDKDLNTNHRQVTLGELGMDSNRLTTFSLVEGSRKTPNMRTENWFYRLTVDLGHNNQPLGMTVFLSLKYKL